jgi:hypothetical protein
VQYRWEPKTAVGWFTLRRLVREGRSQGDGSKQLRSLQWLFFACTVVTTASRERQCLRLLTCCNNSTHDDRRKRWLFLASHATLRTAKVAQSATTRTPSEPRRWSASEDHVLASLAPLACIPPRLRPYIASPSSTLQIIEDRASDAGLIEARWWVSSAMFANAATNTRRMKGSAVFHSFKAWASKLHQQLPLSQRESQRLLTLLTTSFRRRLDEAHPRSAAVDGNDAQPKLSPPQHLDHRALHSSAAAADSHLAAILTSPLLSRGTSTVNKASLDLAHAKLELRKDARDPITLLEELHAQGRASVAICRLCLEQFEKDLLSLPVPVQKELVAKVQPGKRALLWLWQSRLHESEVFVDDKLLIDLLTEASVREGLDDYLWKWLKMDIETGRSWGHGDVAVKSDSFIKSQFHKYRWKGRVLRAMVLAKVKSTYGAAGSLDAALDVFIEAAASRCDAGETNGLKWLPLEPAGSALHGLITHKRLPHETVDLRRYERFKGFARSWDRDFPFGPAVSKAIMDLYHPRRPTGTSMLELFKHFSATPLDPAAHAYLTKKSFPPHGVAGKKSDFWYRLMLSTSATLRHEGLRDGADYLVDHAKRLFPEHRDFLVRDLAQSFQRHEALIEAEAEQAVPVDGPAPLQTTPRFPFPSLT